MIWVGSAEMLDANGINRLGSYMGVMGQSPYDASGASVTIDEGDRSTSERYGYRIATAAQRWQK
jgi:NAD(P)H dehydrogenase (quinone)